MTTATPSDAATSTGPLAGIDRRLRRSARPQLASRFCLQSLARRHRLNALVLADQHGRLVAGAEGEPCGAGFLANRIADGYGQAVAELAPATFARTVTVDALWARFGAPVHSAPLFVGPLRYYVVAIGPPESARSAVAGASSALSRILAEA
jgi:hypothetical protein